MSRPTQPGGICYVPSTPPAPLPEGPHRTKSAPVGVVSKVIRILERLSQAPGGILLREIAIRREINRSTAYRFLRNWKASTTSLVTLAAST